MHITRRRLARGFTLIELLVSFAIIGFAMALVPMAYSKLNQAIEYRASIRDFITQVADARLKAMTTGQPAAIRVNLSNKTYGVDGLLDQSWPATYEIKATVAEQDIEAGKIASIQFYPDGSSTGGSISIFRAPGVGVRFRIDWLTGRMNQEVSNGE